MSHLPRNGQYEVFSTRGKTHCFDDPELPAFPTPKGMFEWIRAQDPEYWHAISNAPDSNVALYLKPELYTLWKLKWT